jgi:hypothetical protein
MKVEVTRFVSAGEKHNFLGRDVSKGEVFYEFSGYTYGCIDERLDGTGGIALSEKGPFDTPFFEFPSNAVEMIP